MQLVSEVDRRGILKTAAALVLGFHLPARGAEAFQVNAWIRITPDNRITLLTEVPEMGQGTRTANAMMLADELEADWSAIQVEQAPTIPEIYKHLGTGGSGGTSATWMPMRKAGAQAREMLIVAAAATLGGVALNFTSLDHVKALYWSAVVNGVLAAPLMAVMMVIASNPRIMGRLTLPRPMLVVGWLATSVMALATVGFFSI